MEEAIFSDVNLPPEIEKCFPDYSLYPQFDFAD